MKYYATFSANSGSTYTRVPFSGTNKRNVMSDVIGSLRAELFSGNSGHWSVRNENGKGVAAGTVRNCGGRYSYTRCDELV